MEKEQDCQNEDKDGCTQPDAPELAAKGGGRRSGAALRGRGLIGAKAGVGFAVRAVQCGFGRVLGVFGR